MKIFKKALITTGVLLCYSNNALATTTGKLVVEESSSGMGKIFLFIMAIALVALVLFVGYKMDKNEAQEKRKEKIIKKRNDDINDMYSEIYTSYNEKEDNISGENFQTSESTQKIDVVEENEEIEYIAKEYSKEDFEYSDLEKENEVVENNKEFEDITDEEGKFEDIIDDNEEVVKSKVPSFKFLTEEYEKEQEKQELIYDDEEEELEEEKNVTKNETIIGDETQVVSLNEIPENNGNSTMVFDTTALKEFNEDGFEKMIGVKGYDYEDDDIDLKELEQTIADSNIKKFTRKKDEIQEVVETKKYTRKKDEVKTKKESKKTKTDKEVKKRKKRKRRKKY